MRSHVPTVLITGANRGIGLEHARAYAAQGWRVLACARDPARSQALVELQRSYPEQIEPMALDVTDHAAVDALASELNDETIDVLLNNAGTFGPQGFPDGMAYQGLEQMDYEIWRQILEVNLLSPFKVAVAFHDHLARAERPLLVMMTSDLGSIAQNTQGKSYAYRTSKAGLNMVTRGIAQEWPDIIVIAMAPGWCKTDLGGDIAHIETKDSVREQQRTFARVTLEESGRVLDRFGAVVAW
ncbi:MAG: SDR family oxidoreductase [Chromatiales bacterium]|nr:MAG: SDR family oxidoreductase [Chromatiales bacterium]